MHTTRIPRTELLYLIVYYLALSEDSITTANVQFGCWSNLPVGNSCSELKDTSIMEFVVGKIQSLQMREETVFDFVNKFE